MDMQQIIPCQIVYAATGFFFNLESWRRFKSGGKRLTSTDPVKGMLMMLIVTAVTMSYTLAGGWIYRIGWVVIVLKIAPTGVLRHLRSVVWSGDYSSYASPRMAYAALIINVFGVCAGLLGLFQSFVFN